MPLFEYECKSCGHQFEALVRSNERAKCPTCGGGSLQKLLSTFNAGASRTMAKSCEGRTPFCQPARCSSGACPHAAGN